MATSSACYNHDDRVATWFCMDCKPDSSIKYCKECHDNVHMLPVFRLHRTQALLQSDKRRLSQDVSDLQKLVVVEKDILSSVLTTLRYTQQQEREMLQYVVKKSEQRLHDIQQCHEKVEKALLYLAKVSTAIASCSDSDVPPSQVPKRLATVANEIPEQQDRDGLPQFPVEVVGSLVKTGCFWMIRKTVADKQKLIKIEHELKEYFKDNAPSPLSSSPLKEGTICAIKNHSNTEFWRVRVEKLCPKQMVKVRYLDYGMLEEIPLSLIIDLPSALRLIPFQAMECCLFPLTAKVSLPYEAKWCFKDLTHGKDLMARICSQMIYPQGYCVYHVQLTLTGPVPTNINQKVADLLEQTKMDEEEQPILPKDEVQEKPKNVPENKGDKETEPGLKLKEKPVAENQPNPDPKVVSPGEPTKPITILTRKNEDQLNKEDSKSPTDLLSLILGNNKQDCVIESPPNAAENTNVINPSRDTKDGVTNTLSDRPDGMTVTKTKDVLEHSVKTLSKDVLTTATETKRPLNTGEVAQDSAKSLEAIANSSSVKEFVPVGFVNQEMYQNLLEKYKFTDWTAFKGKIYNAKFFIVKGSPRQFIEALKTLVWCVLDEKLANQIDRTYKEQTSRNCSLFLIFVTRGTILGLVEVVSEKKDISHCSILIPGLMWHNHCRGEFDIEVVTMNQFRFHLLENESFLWNFFKDYHSIGREIRFERGQNICYRFEHLKFYFPLINWGLKQYQNRQGNEPLGSQENFSSLSDEDQSEEQTDIFVEDWEPDLESQPARVAEIYSNISSPRSSVCSHSEKPGEHEDFETLTGEQEEEAKQQIEAEQATSKDVEVIPETDQDTSDKTTTVDEETFQEEKNVSVENSAVSSSVLTADDTKPVELSGEINSTQIASQPEMNQGSPEEPMKESYQDIVSENQNTQSSTTIENTTELPNTQHRLGQVQNLNPTIYYAVSPPRTPNIVKTTEPQPTEQHVDSGVNHVNGPDVDANKGGVFGDNVNIQNVDGQVVGSGYAEVICDDGANVNSGSGVNDGPVWCDGNVSQDNENSGVDNRSNGANNFGEKGNSECVNPEEQAESDDDQSLDEESGLKFERFARETDQSSASAWVESSGFHSDGQDSDRSSPLFDQADTGLQDEDAPFLPVQKGKKYSIFMCEDPGEDGHFWARVIRGTKDEERYKRFEKELTKNGRTCAPVNHLFLLKYCLFENTMGFYQRAQVTKMPTEKLVDVWLIDAGRNMKVHLDHLRELPDRYITCMPPQSFLCKTSDLSALLDKMRKHPKRQRKNFDIDVVVKSIQDYVVNVKVLSVRLQSYKYHKKY